MNKKLQNMTNLVLDVCIETVHQAEGVFVIIGGSGKIDLDGNHKLFKMNIYKDISNQLNKMGFSTVRYSKRGTGLSEGNHNKTGLQDLLDDLHTVVANTKNQFPNQKIYLLGHSEGAMLATLYTRDHQVDGMILVSGAGIGLKDALRIQNDYLASEIKTLKGFKGKVLRLLLNETKINKQQTNIFHKVQSTEKDIIRVQLIPIAAKWMRQHFQYDTLDYLKMLQEVEIPTLVIQGDKDAHTNLDFITNIKALENPHITINVLSNVDHILRDYNGEVTILGIKKQYKKEVKKPVSTKFQQTIREWVLAS